MYIPTQQQEPQEQRKGLVGKIKNFVQQSERVLNVTHKPKPDEFKHIAFSTALGMIVIGLIGFAVSMAAFFLKG
ncbi:MAG: protein translocase SEC61 complex subunit gamma [Candidatus Micrarchaeia archaeon]|jgi:protein transport protein SEC61 subunit gamma-like protein